MIGWWRELDRILKGDATRLSSLRRGTIEVSALGLSLVIVILGAAAGACMGSFSLVNSGWRSWPQMVASAVKVPALFFLTLLVTFPSLYVFNALVGSRLTMPSLGRLLIAGMGVLLAVLASQGPIVAFFSLSTTSYSFMVLLNVAVFAVSGFLGLVFLLRTLGRLDEATSQINRHAPVVAEVEVVGEEDEKDPGAEIPGALDPVDGQALGRRVKRVFRCWIILFGVVGSQMAWVLRPFIGDPARPFHWFRARESNFFQAVWQAIQSLLYS